MLFGALLRPQEALSRVKSGDLCEPSESVADRMTIRNSGPMEDLPGDAQAPWGFLN